MNEQNPPAFPTVSNARPEHVGMSLRDYFAGQCLVGVINEAKNEPGGLLLHQVAELAYELSDAMLEARKVKDE